MDERLRQLAARIASIPEGGDDSARAALRLGKVLAIVLAKVRRIPGTAAQKKELLSASSQVIDSLSESLGEDDEVPNVLREMHALATVIVEGPQPPAAQPPTGGRLDQLAAHVLSVPEPDEGKARAVFRLIKVQAVVLARIPQMEGTAAQKQELLAASLELIDALGKQPGEQAELVNDLRRMHAIATAVVEGAEDPPAEAGNTERLRQLAGRILDIPEPPDADALAVLRLVKVQATVLAGIDEIAGTAAQKQELLAASLELIDALAEKLGEDDELVNNLRHMHAIATAIVEGAEGPAGSSPTPS